MTSKPARKNRSRTGPEIIVEASCGNVFADLGFPDADVLLAKAGLVFHITQTISARRLTQKRAAEILGIDQPGVSDLLRGRLNRFSSDRLIRFLNALGQDVDIMVTACESSRPRPGRLRVRNGNARPATSASQARPQATRVRRTPVARPGIRRSPRTPSKGRTP